MQKLAVLIGSACLILFSSCATTATETGASDSIQKLILEGKYDEAKAMFESQTNINAADENGNTSLHAAAQVNNADLVTFLIFKGAKTELKNNDGDTALHIAIANDSVEAAGILAEQNGDIFSRNGSGITALEMGIQKGPAFYEALLTPETGSKTDGAGKTIMHHLVQNGQTDAIQYAIRQMLPLSVKDNEGLTPLHLAYMQDTAESIRIAVEMLEADAVPVGGEYDYFETSVRQRNPSIRYEAGQTPLHAAAILGQTGVVQYLISERAALAAQNIIGSTPLHEAVRYGRTDIAELLLKAGAPPNAKDSMGKTPMLLIIPQNVQAEMYRLLISYNADVNAKDMYGDAPLHTATLNGSSADVLKILTNAGADVNERNKQGVTPLSLAVESQRKDLAKFYVDNGSDIHAEDMQGRTPLTRALRTNIQMLSMLVTKKNISSRDSYGNTPLHIAVITDVPEFATDGSSDPDRKISLVVQNLRYMIDLKADINARNRSGDTPLSVAVQQNKRQAGEVLLAAKADIYTTNTDNYSPLRLALTAGGERLDWMLNTAVINSADGSGNTPLHYAAEWKLHTAITTLVDKGAPVNAQNANGETPLFNAVRADSPECIAILIRNGAQKNARDYMGNTPLHESVRWNAYKAADALLAAGAAIDAKNRAGKTALAEAAHTAKIQLAALFLNRGADINAADATGKTVLIDGIQSGDTEIVKLLLSRGASVQMQEMYGRNSYHFAAAGGNVEMIGLVRDAGGNPMARDKNGQTPLTLVLAKGDAAIKAVLGGDKEIADSDGNTPIHIAVANGAPADTMRLLISLGYPVDNRNSDGLTPLAEAANLKEDELVRVLLENGADPYIADNRDECAVSFALKNDDLELLASIVKYAGNKRDIAGEGILHYAARIAGADTINRLISMGVDKSTKSISGETAYDIAVRWKRSSIAELLK